MMMAEEIKGNIIIICCCYGYLYQVATQLSLEGEFKSVVKRIIYLVSCDEDIRQKASGQP